MKKFIDIGTNPYLRSIFVKSQRVFERAVPQTKSEIQGEKARLFRFFDLGKTFSRPRSTRRDNVYFHATRHINQMVGGAAEMLVGGMQILEAFWKIFFRILQLLKAPFDILSGRRPEYLPGGLYTSIVWLFFKLLARIRDLCGGTLNVIEGMSLVCAGTVQAIAEILELFYLLVAKYHKLWTWAVILGVGNWGYSWISRQEETEPVEEWEDDYEDETGQEEKDRLAEIYRNSKSAKETRPVGTLDLSWRKDQIYQWITRQELRKGNDDSIDDRLIIRLNRDSSLVEEEAGDISQPSGITQPDHMRV